MPVSKTKLPDSSAPLEEKRHELQKHQEDLDKIFSNKGEARYKIEVLFAHTRRTIGPTAGALSIWESGAKFHGGGDAKMYWCPGKSRKKNDCTGVIPDSSNGFGYLACPTCQTVWTGDDVIGELFFKVDAWGWTDIILKHYAMLGHNADIYTKYPKVDLRAASRAEQTKQLMGEQLSKVRGERVLVIYPLANIIKDVSAGADLRNRFHAFLTA